MTEALTGMLMFILYMLKTTIGAKMSLFSVLPDPVLVVLICYSMEKGKEKGVLFGIAAGLAAGFLCGGPVSRYVITYMLSAALAGIMGNAFFGKNSVTASAITMMISLVYGIVMSALLYMLKTDKQIGTYLVFRVLPFCIYNTLLAAVMYPAVRAADNVRYRR